MRYAAALPPQCNRQTQKNRDVQSTDDHATETDDPSHHQPRRPHLLVNQWQDVVPALRFYSVSTFLAELWGWPPRAGCGPGGDRRGEGTQPCHIWWWRARQSPLHQADELRGILLGPNKLFTSLNPFSLYLVKKKKITLPSTPKQKEKSFCP